MRSNSIRVGTRLFSLAQQEGALMSRSPARQIEHWARLGAAVQAGSRPTRCSGGKAKAAKLVNSPY